ncbi:peptidylprolyl isomerase [Elusimicrobiota bacterium]
MRKTIAFLCALFLLAGLSLEAAKAAKRNKKKKSKQKVETVLPTKPGLYAIFNTTQGTFIAELFEKQTPITVENFVGLATGEKPWTDTKSGKTVTKRFYDGLIFHRVIAGFMIQGGCPLGNGRGDPGYKFEDEIVAGLTFKKVGKLAMANSGPGTNGSQFFVTVEETTWLNGKHTIFGQVVKGMDIVDKISAVKTRSDTPLEDVVITKLDIKRVKPKKAESKKKDKKKK